MSITVAHDVTHANIGSAPAGQLAGYCTGTSDIAWTAQDWLNHPGAVRIDQSPVNTALDELADILDVENGAARPANCAPWSRAAAANFTGNHRPGQREPAIYCSASAVTSVVNALVSGGVKSGVGLWIANWNLTEAQAIADVLNASGPFPVIGIQLNDTAPGPSDTDVFSVAWLTNQSGVAGSIIQGGDSGPAVAAAQKLLKVTADGLFGTGTLGAVRAFQGAHSLAQDGVIGPLTWSALEAAAPPPAPAPGPTPPPVPVPPQNGIVYSVTTGRWARVRSSDGGHTWLYPGTQGGTPADQKGYVVSVTTGGLAKVTTGNGGLTWNFGTW